MWQPGRLPTGHGSHLGLRQRRLRAPTPGAARGHGTLRTGAAGARHGRVQGFQGSDGWGMEGWGIHGNPINFWRFWWILPYVI